MRPQRTRRLGAWIIPAGLVTICSVLSFSRSWFGTSLDWTRDGVASGQCWRLVSGHVEHVDGSHAFLDIAALVLVAWTFSRDLDRWTSQMAVLACGAVAIDAALWVLHPEVARYAGLSGLLHAWFAAGATLWVAHAFERPVDRGRVLWGALLIAGLAAKLSIEAHGDAFWGAGFEVPVITSAHRWGAAGGVVAGAALAMRRRRGRA